MGSKKKEAKKALKQQTKELSKDEKNAAKEIKKRDKTELIEKLNALSVPKDKILKKELVRVFGKSLEPEMGGTDERIWFDGGYKLRSKFNSVGSIERRLLYSILQKLPSYSEII